MIGRSEEGIGIGKKEGGEEGKEKAGKLDKSWEEKERRKEIREEEMDEIALSGEKRRREEWRYRKERGGILDKVWKS